MKVLIELPTWLGDSVMTTPAIENVIKHLIDPEITLIGSSVSIELLKNHPKVIQTYILDKKIINFFKTLVNMQEFDYFFSFRASARSKLLKKIVNSNKKYQYNKRIVQGQHQVEKYNSFVNHSLKIKSTPGSLKLHFKNQAKKKLTKIVGINPGASYGSAKRWYPKEFANVAQKLSPDFDIIIFGGPNEKKFALDIENYLNEKNVTNYKNLAGKTSVIELMSFISGLDLLVTGDSGPMHIAAAFQVPTISIFGPTSDIETSPWMNKKNMILKKNLGCQPCMKRICPLNHHNCMKQIKAQQVLELINKI
jgi:heptosyltransferase II